MFLVCIYKILQKTALPNRRKNLKALSSRTRTRTHARTHAHIKYIYILFLQVQPGRYFILNTPAKSFYYNVKDKFEKVIPEDLRKEVDLVKTLDELNIAGLVPQIKYDGDFDKRYKRGLDNIEDTASNPAAAEAGASPAKLQKQTTGSQGAPRSLNLSQNYRDTAVQDYHLDQVELFPDTRDIVMSLPEFIQYIDEKSKSVMEEYKNSAPVTTAPSAEGEDLRSKIEKCKNVLVKRLNIHMTAENDLMTDTGYRVWRNHAWAAASYAVYYVSLQLLRMKKVGSFYD